MHEVLELDNACACLCRERHNSITKWPWTVFPVSHSPITPTLCLVMLTLLSLGNLSLNTLVLRSAVWRVTFFVYWHVSWHGTLMFSWKVVYRTPFPLLFLCHSHGDVLRSVNCSKSQRICSMNDQLVNMPALWVVKSPLQQLTSFCHCGRKEVRGNIKINKHSCAPRTSFLNTINRQIYPRGQNLPRPVMDNETERITLSWLQ